MNRERRMTKYVQGPQGRGFTIVELLVVIAVIGILMGLLLPAIQAARESGRKTACMSNVYQIAMAMNRYDQDKGKLPGWMKRVYCRNDGIDNNRKAGVDEANEHLTWSWPPELLPYLERRDIYDMLVSNLYPVWTDTTLTAAQKKGIAPGFIGTFTCPSSPPNADNFAPSAYAANAGDMTGNQYNGVLPPGDFPNGTSSATNSLEDVADGDGTATTLLLAEIAAYRNDGAQGTWAYIGNLTDASGAPFGYGVFTYPNSDGFTSVTTSTTGYHEGWLTFGHQTAAQTLRNTRAKPESSHIGGYVVAFCDGHSYFISSDIDSPVYMQLVTSNNSRSDSLYKAMILDESKY